MFDQLLVGAAPGDAITGSVLLLQQELARLGPSEIYSQHLEAGVRTPVRPLAELATRPNADRPLVFHASMGSWPVYQALRAEPRLILVYHNFSPPEHYVEFNPEVAGDLVRGRWELEQIRPRVELAIAVSEYNAEELRAIGYERVVVVPPTPDVDRLNRIVPDPAMLGRISSWSADPLVLCVAQLLPHKRIERVLAALAVLQQEHLPGARLALVGVDRFEKYSTALRVMARTLGLREPQFLGRVTDAELSALYLRAEVFLTLSEHEGFCVPAVEAMAIGVPVVASARAAIPSTVADAGLLVDDPDDPALVAALLHRATTDEHLRRILIGRGVSRAKRLSAATSLPELARAVLSTRPDALERYRLLPDGSPRPAALGGVR
ncbi:MAG TPA: glycosyltransferase [Aquihabitans sp.]|jgi:glycosyltransferase involved in cell wall biosynthesis|nr:glycosyltransferase [Aquihabitans sp.]